MVLRRTVCGRRPWSEALAGGGPSIPLPSTRKKSNNGRPFFASTSAKTLYTLTHTGKATADPNRPD